MRRELKLSALRTSLDQDGVEKGDEVVFFCPPPPLGHGNPRNRPYGQLSVNLVTDEFNCWSCGLKGRNLYRLLAARGKTKISQDYLIEQEESRRSGIVVKKPEKEYDPPALPPEFKTLSVRSKSPYYRAALAYLARRGLVTDDILRWKLGYCESGELAGRIVIPSFDRDGELNYVVGRSFYDDPYRYRPYPRHVGKDLVWNDYMVDWTRPVRLTEGPFDAFTIGDNVTILQGTNLPEALVSRIVMSGVDVYFAMDADAFHRQLRHIEVFLSYGITCRYVDIKGRKVKDVGTLTRAQYLELERESKLIRSDLDILKMRICA